jgi:hypothetical protein
MKCRECECCHEVILNKWSPINGKWITKTVQQCWGVKEPFEIEDINVECTEYPDRRDKTIKDISIEKAIEHFKYGISHDIFKEPVTSYAKMAVEALEKQIPKKPTYVDTRFRNHGRSIADGSSLSKCYKCPNCSSHIFHVFDSETNCEHCGQALDWN